ncbi:MAG: hypothetical protein M1832_005903 [Thelocarpon impressellum]|nr:MAG: hypothetical protein M1832_005903 [Thelocarpon impressellum]
MNFVHYHGPSQRTDDDEAANARDSGGSMAPAGQDRDERRGEVPASSVPAAAEPATADEPEEVDMSADMATRPRLTREQAALLESQFEVHYKPNTAIKRELAKTTGLSLPRVANWFQNRRAKAKQLKRQSEREALEAARREGPGGAPDGQCPPEYFFSATFPAAQLEQHPRQPADGAAPGQPQQGVALLDAAFPRPHYDPSAEAPYASMSRSLAAAAAAVAEGAYDERWAGDGVGMGASPHKGLRCGAAQIDGAAPVTAFSDWSSGRASSAVWTPARPMEDPVDRVNLGLRQARRLGPEPQHDIREVHSNFSGDMTANHFEPPFVMPVFPSQIARIQQLQQLQEQARQQPQPQQQPQQIVPRFRPAAAEEPVAAPADRPSMADPFPADFADAFVAPDQPSRQGSFSSVACLAFDASAAAPASSRASPESSPDGLDGRLDIAARRKRPRPAALGSAALRSHSYMGSFPVSPTTKGPFLGAPSVRRIKSTGNSLNQGRGRIQKSTPGSAQRSPLNFETFADAGALNDVNLHSLVRLGTSSSGSTSGSGSFAPPTPLSPLDMARFGSEASSGQGQDEPGFAYGAGYPGCFVPTTIEMQANLASPPTTPHHALQAYRQQANVEPRNWAAPHSAGLLGFGSGVTDEAVISPQTSCFPAQLHMPQPMYVSPLNCDADLASPLAAEFPYRVADDLPGSGSPFIPEFLFDDLPAQHASQHLAHHTSQHLFQHSSQQAPTLSATCPPQQGFQQAAPAAAPQPQPKQKSYVFANQTPEDFDP